MSKSDNLITCKSYFIKFLDEWEQPLVSKDVEQVKVFIDELDYLLFNSEDIDRTRILYIDIRAVRDDWVSNYNDENVKIEVGIVFNSILKLLRRNILNV